MRGPNAVASTAAGAWRHTKPVVPEDACGACYEGPKPGHRVVLHKWHEAHAVAEGIEASKRHAWRARFGVDKLFAGRLQGDLCSFHRLWLVQAEDETGDVALDGFDFIAASRGIEFDNSALQHADGLMQ